MRHCSNGSENRSLEKVGSSLQTCAHSLECVIGDQLNYCQLRDNEKIDNVEFDPVHIFMSTDASLLKCLPPDHSHGDLSEYSIFGFEEYQYLSSGPDNKAQCSFDAQDLKVEVDVYRPSIKTIEASRRSIHPSADWSLAPPTNDGRKSVVLSKSSDNNSSFSRKVTMIDLTILQKARKENKDAYLFRLDSPGAVLHFLRSAVTSCRGHCASPWRNSQKEGCEGDCMRTDSVFAIIMRNRYQGDEDLSSLPGDDQEPDVLEKKELKQMVDFRTGDAIPSYFLHSVSELKNDFRVEDFQTKLQCNGEMNTEEGLNTHDSISSTLLVFRRLPQRCNLSKTLSSLDNKSNASSIDDLSPNGTLWEKYRKHEIVKSDYDESNIMYRLVSPPYLDHAELYPKVLESFMDSENMKLLTAEAKSIPQWTAWPEKNHYESEIDSQGAYPASWTVFPLCHTFPATDASARKWIDVTCSYTPHTTALLKSMGPALRTALFSRLNPRTRLGDHTGWSDLANHVLRVHIPIEIPTGNYNDGLCGTWVDGCVETHSKDSILCFDDSKVHRAFNYSDEERIVLIIDLARPGNLPEGTAVGGHTDELDSFLKEFT